MLIWPRHKNVIFRMMPISFAQFNNKGSLMAISLLLPPPTFHQQRGQFTTGSFNFIRAEEAEMMFREWANDKTDQGSGHDSALNTSAHPQNTSPPLERRSEPQRDPRSLPHPSMLKMKKASGLAHLKDSGEGTGSEYTNGSRESFWTLYLGRSSSSDLSDHGADGEDDLSMLSDASSGPPHLVHHKDGDGGNDSNCLCCCNERDVGGGKRRKVEEDKDGFSLEDSASSSPSQGKPFETRARRPAPPAAQ